MKYESYNQYGELIRTHRTAYAAVTEANKPKHDGGYACILADDGTRTRIHQGTTEDIVRGKVDISRLIEGSNHRLLPDGTVATKCVDGHEKITRISDDGRCWGYYNVLYV